MYTFRGGFSLTDEAPLSYTSQIPITLLQIKAVIAFPRKFRRSRNLKVQIVVQEFRLNAIFIFCKFFFPFLQVGNLEACLKKSVEVFVNSIAFKSYKTFSKLFEKPCGINARKWLGKERSFGIIEFIDRFLLIKYFSSFWPNLTESGQIIVELQVLKVSPPCENKSLRKQRLKKILATQTSTAP